MADDRERYGRLAHDERLAVNAERDKPFHLTPWEQRTPEQRELDERIGAAVAVQAVADAGIHLAAMRGRLRAVAAECTRHGNARPPGVERDAWLAVAEMALRGAGPAPAEQEDAGQLAFDAADGAP